MSDKTSYRTKRRSVTLDRDPFNLIEGSLILPAVVKLRRPRRLVVGDVLRRFEGALVLQVRGDAGRAESVVSDPSLDAGVGRAALNPSCGRSCGRAGRPDRR